MTGALPMWRSLRPLRRLRILARRHRTVFNVLRLLMIFSAAFGGSYGFITGSRAPNSGYDPHAFAIGVSFLFALSCVALAALTLRNRLLKRAVRNLAQHNEALADRNWELKETADRARSLFEAQSDLIVVRDRDGLIVDANEVFAAFAGRSRAELVGTPFALTIVAQSAVIDAPDGTRAFDQQIATNAGLRWIAWREAMVRSDAGPPDWQCVGRDITDRAETTRQLAEARAQADAANRAKSRFLAMASHEIRTPLNGILGMSGLLLETPLSADQTTYVRAVKASGDALLTLIEELLDDARIEAGTLQLDDSRFSLAALVESVTELLAPRAQVRGLEIAADIDERLPAEWIGDAARLRQVLLNLAGNALKFTSEGGVAISVLAHDTTIAFIVRDTGIGISPEAQARIFGAFEQGDESTAQRYGGVGLGLAISERIVRQMGGSLQVESVPGEGATFTLSLPLRPAQAAETGAAFAVPDLRGRHILIVSGKPIETSLVAKRLERWGAQVIVIADPDIASALLPERDWHAVLCDHDIAAGARSALTAAARRHAARCILMLTPAERAALQGVLPDGFSAWLTRPLRAASLAARLRDAEEDNPAGDAATLVPADPEAVSDPAPACAGPGLSILVAEDNEINALLVRALLTRLGHSPVVVSDGAAALDSWLLAARANTPYDLVLMDLQMPGMDGVTAVTRIREAEREQGARRTPIHALTANALAEDRALCAAADMDGFLVKPLDRDKLENVIANVEPARSVAA
jgi:PAS domain S-box-containing protein